MQLAEVIDCLDKEYWEADLYLALEEIRDEVHAHMDISEDLTNKTRGNNKSFLTAANGKDFVVLFFSLTNEMPPFGFSMTPLMFSAVDSFLYG